MKAEGDVYRLFLCAKSYTLDMDITTKERIFQDTNMGVQEVIRYVMKGYSNQKVNFAFENQPIGQLFVQYKETDWEFIKRVLSNYGENIYIDNTANGIRFHAGIPEGSHKTQLVTDFYSIEKDLNQYQVRKHRKEENLLESDMLEVNAQSYQVLRLGESVEFINQEFIIYEAKRKLMKGLLVNEYKMKSRKGLRKSRYYNELLTGVSIDGTILDVKRNLVKAKLLIDGPQTKESAYWFRFSTVSASAGGNGWYCMPKIGESVRAYFPENKENEGYIIAKVEPHQPDTIATSVKSQGSTEVVDPMGDPNVKNITTPSGQELLFTPEGVVLRVGGGTSLMQLNQDGSVVISGVNSISLSAIEEIKIRAEDSIKLSGVVHMEATCTKGGQIVLDPDHAKIHAEKIIEN